MKPSRSSKTLAAAHWLLPILLLLLQQQQQPEVAAANLIQYQGLQPVINPFVFNQYVQENQRLSVLCQVPIGDTPITISWLKDGQPLNGEAQLAKRITVKPDSSDSTLKFASVRLEHAGNYTCVAKNRFGQAAYSSQLLVHSEPRWLREPQHEPIVATRGQTIVIDCQTTGWPKPHQSWLIKTPKQDIFEPLAVSSRISVALNGSLLIRQADKSDEANYLCKSSNGIGKGLSWSTSLKVNVPAHFANNRQLINSVRKYAPVQLRCDAFGDEPITIEWFKDSQRISNELEARYSIYTQPIQNGLVSTLVVKKTQRQDNSLFECVARNQAGRDTLPIELQVQEEPDAIHDLQCAQRNSRSVSLSWQEPYDGRTPITSYIFQYKKVQEASSELLGGPMLDDAPEAQLATGAKLTTNADDWQQAQRIMLPASSLASNRSQLANVVSINIDKLEPASKYVLRALAVNAIGQSRFSQPLEFETLEEAPEHGPRNISAVALNSTSILVTWDEIPRTKRPLHGYYVGYRALGPSGNASGDFVFKFTDQQAPGGQQADSAAPQRLDTVLSDLKRATNYEITVRASNRQGSGPMVEFVQCRTNEMEKPKAVKLSIRREPDDQSIFVEWHRDPSDQNPVDDYTLYQEKNSASQQWLQMRLPGNQTQYRPPGLKCGTRYQFYIVAHNKVGKSPQSEVVAASTSGSLPLVPTKPQLIRMINSTCLLLNLNSFQEVGCRIRNFETTVRYRTDKVKEQTPLAADPNGQQAAPAKSTSSAPAGATVATALSAMTDKAAEWETVRPKGQTHHHHNHLQANRRGSAEDDRLEYLCDLDPLGEYNIHVAASTDVGRAEIEYTVLMSSDELRQSALRGLLDLIHQLPNVFTYIPSLLVFMLAGLLIGLVSMVLYTTALRYYQKFVIMHNQLRATRRAKRDQKRRRELNGSRHQKLDSWADDYGLEVEEDEEKVEEENYDGDNDEAQRTLSCHDDDDDDDDGGMETDIMTDDTGSSSLGGPGRKYQFTASATRQQRHNRRRQVQQVPSQQRSRLAGHYLTNLNSSSAFDSSSIDSPCNNNNNNNKFCNLSTASTDSIHNRFQCLNSKQYVKMNEYTMLPSISATLSPPNDLYGTTGVQQQQQQNANNSIYYSTLRRTTNMQTYLPHRVPPQPNQMALAGSRQSSPGQPQQQSPSRQQQQQKQQQQQQQQQHRLQSQISDIYGYYVSPHQVQMPNNANYQQVATQQAQREAANSIFVPPQQIIYSAPNMRHQPVFL